QLVVKPARAKRGFVRGELVRLAPRGERVEGTLGGEHSRLDRGVGALDARGVEKAGVVADEDAARKRELRQRLQAARGDRARAVRDAPPALENAADRRVRLVALEFLEGMEIRVAVSEPDDEADGDLVRL